MGGTTPSQVRHELNPTALSSNWGASLPYPGGMTGDHPDIVSSIGVIKNVQPRCKISSSDTLPVVKACDPGLNSNYQEWVNYDAESTYGNTDITQYVTNTDPCALMKQCDETPGCVGFNSNGWIKSSISSKNLSAGTRLYVRKTTSTGYYPSNLIWSDSDCPNLGGVTGDLNTCTKTCTNTPGCTAVNWNADAADTNPVKCIMRGCVVGTQPTSKYSTFVGYAKYPLGADITTVTAVPVPSIGICTYDVSGYPITYSSSEVECYNNCTGAGVAQNCKWVRS